MTTEKLKELLKNDLVTLKGRIEFSNKVKDKFLPWFEGLTYEESKMVLSEIEEGIQENMKLTI